MAGVKSGNLTLNCACDGCPGRAVVPIDALADPPGPCSLDHSHGVSAQTFAAYQDLAHTLQRRRVQLGLSQMDIDAAAGWADGYTAKLESEARIPRMPTLQLWAQAVGLEICTRPASLPAGTIRAINNRLGEPYEHGKARFKR